ncbi:unnamed protein product [Arabidopsis arenosa]|uniref:Uncharacterized protein n=1 Tax=Arabidopsis arenosa TaxID=38785 RepID=A0A8S2A0Z0_ARAAE|nr:unnamed protein product [Arabidopsis arenosa]
MFGHEVFIAQIKEQLDAVSVSVKDMSVDGRRACGVQGKSSVNRQRMMYKAICNEELQNVVHAVDQMTTNTPSERFSETGGRKSKERRNLAAIPSRHGSNKDRDRDNSLWTGRVEGYRQCLAHQTQEAHGSTKRLIRY